MITLTAVQNELIILKTEPQIEINLSVDNETYPIDSNVYLLDEGGILLINESLEYLTA